MRHNRPSGRLSRGEPEQAGKKLTDEALEPAFGDMDTDSDFSEAA